MKYGGEGRSTNGQQAEVSGRASPRELSALESLRTVEFRQALRGYHIEDVDEFLERAATEADQLRDQQRQLLERLRQAGERVAALEAQVRERQGQGSHEGVERLLAMAQRFVDRVQAEAEAEARRQVVEAEERAKAILAEAEARARAIVAEAEHGLRDEVTRLEQRRGQLAEHVEQLTRRLEAERARLRTVLAEMLEWAERALIPAVLSSAGTSSPATPPSAAPSPATEAVREGASVAAGA
jgi:cell division initiation protein